MPTVVRRSRYSRGAGNFGYLQPAFTLPDGMFFNMLTGNVEGTVYDTTLVAPTGTTWNVTNAGELQTALNGCADGDLISVALGTYVGPFEMRNRGAGTGYVTIRTASYATLIASRPAGSRVIPGDSSLMPIIAMGGVNGYCLEWEAGAGRFRFVGVKFTNGTQTTTNSSLIYHGIGTSGNERGDLAPSDMVHHVIYDRCIGTQTNASDNTRGGIWMDGLYTAVIDSDLSGFQYPLGADVTAVAVAAGGNHFKVVNNYLESTSENFGAGGTGFQQAMHHSDLEFSRNWVRKDPAWASSAHNVKNLFEMKSMLRAYIGENVFENVWWDAQQGYAFVLWSVNQAGDFVRDVFTDTDNVLLQSHTGSQGATWTRHPSYAGDAQISNANRLHASSGTTALYYASGSPLTADYNVAGFLRKRSATSGAAGIVGRASTSVDTHYLARYDDNVDEWRLYKYVTGTPTQLGSGFAQALTTDQDYWVRLEMRGTSIKVYVDGVERVAVTDSSITAAGKAGVRFDGGAGTDTTGIHLDDFQADSSLTPFAETRDVTVRHNRVVAAALGFNLNDVYTVNGTGLDYPSVAMSRVEIVHNVFEKMNTISSYQGQAFTKFALISANGSYASVAKGVHDLVVANNSGGWDNASADMISVSGQQDQRGRRLTIRDNVLTGRGTGFHSSNWNDIRALTDLYLEVAATGNVFAAPGTQFTGGYAATNQQFANTSSLGWTDYANGDLSLAGGSPALGYGQGARNSGADVARVNALTSGVQKARS